MRKKLLYIGSTILTIATPMIAAISCSDDKGNALETKPDLSILADYDQLKDQQSSKNADFLQDKVGQKIKGDEVRLENLGITFDFLPTTKASFKVATPYDATKEQIEVEAQLSNDDVNLTKKFLVFAQKEATLIIENLDNYLPKTQNITSNKKPSDFKIEVSKFKKGAQVSPEQLGIELNLPSNIQANIVIFQEYDFLQQNLKIEIKLTKDQKQSKTQVYEVKATNPQADLTWLSNQISSKSTQDLQKLYQELGPFANISQSDLGINLQIPSDLKVTFTISPKAFADGLYVNAIIEKPQSKIINQEFLIYSNEFLKYDNFYYADSSNYSAQDQGIVNYILDEGYGDYSPWKAIDYFYGLGKGDFINGEIVYTFQGLNQGGDLRQIKIKQIYDDSLPPEGLLHNLQVQVQLNNSDWVAREEFAKIGIERNEIRVLEEAIGFIDTGGYLAKYLFNYFELPVLETLSPNSEVPKNFIGSNWAVKDYYQTKIIFKSGSQALEEISKNSSQEIYDMDKVNSLVKDYETIFRFKILQENPNYWSGSTAEFIEKEHELDKAGEGESQISFNVSTTGKGNANYNLEINVDNIMANEALFLFFDLGPDLVPEGDMAVITPSLHNDPNEFEQFTNKFEWISYWLLVNFFF